MRSRSVSAFVLVLLLGIGVIPVSGQTVTYDGYVDRLAGVQALIAGGHSFTPGQIDELRNICSEIEDAGFPDLAGRCRFLLFLAEEGTRADWMDGAEGDAAVLRAERKAEVRDGMTRALIGSGIAFTTGFNILAGVSDAYYSRYLKIARSESLSTGELQSLASSYVMSEVMYAGAWISAGLGAVGFILAGVSNANSLAGTDVKPEAVIDASPDPEYERIDLEAERGMLEDRIENREKTATVLKAVSVGSLGGAIASGTGALVVFYMRELSERSGDEAAALDREKIAGGLGIIAGNLLGTWIVTTLVKPNVSRLEERLTAVDARLWELAVPPPR